MKTESLKSLANALVIILTVSTVKALGAPAQLTDTKSTLISKYADRLAQKGDDEAKRALKQIILPPLKDSKDTPQILKIDIQTSREGGIHGGGGVTAQGPHGNRVLLDLIEKDELTYFYPEAESQSFSIKRIADLYIQSAGGTFESFQKYEKENVGDPEFILSLMLSLDSTNEFYRRNTYMFDIWKIKPLKPLRWAFTELELEKISDEGEIRLENEKTKRQVAIQKDGIVIVNKNEFQLLDEDSKAALFLHEGVLRVVLALNPKNILAHGTKDVRTYTRRLYFYMQNSKDYPVESVREAYDAFEIKDHSELWEK